MIKAFLLILFLLALCHVVYAQTDSLRVNEKGGSVKEEEEELKLSESFLKALEGAFSFDPVTAPLPKQNELTVEQLHEWVGKPTAQDSINYFRSFNAPRASKFDATYKALKMWVKEFYVPISPPSEKIHFDLGPMPNPNPHGFDVSKTLGEYLRPKEIRMRKLRTRAQKHLKELDELYPVLIEK